MAARCNSNLRRMSTVVEKTEGLVVLEEVSEGVGLMTLNNPAQLNPLSVEMADAIQATVRSIPKAHPTMRALVLTGAGRAFSAGGSFSFLQERVECGSVLDNAETLFEFYSKFLSVRTELPNVVTIGAINGPAVGGGLGLALACDLRLAMKDTYFSANFSQLGIASGAGASYLLPQIVGHQFAAYMLLTGQKVPADKAKEVGLVLEVSETTPELVHRSLEIAKQIAAVSPISLQLILESLRLHHSSHIEDALQRDSHDQAISFAGPDIVEGIAAAKEHRPPRFHPFARVVHRVPV